MCFMGAESTQNTYQQGSGPDGQRSGTGSGLLAKPAARQSLPSCIVLASPPSIRFWFHDATSMIAQLTGLVDALEDGAVRDRRRRRRVSRAVRLVAHPRGPAAPAWEVAKLLVETHVREDAIQLFGFTDTTERDWFRLLTTVQGVGPRVALSILSALAPRDLIGAIAARDQASLTRAPGVGARLAARLLTELKDKVGTMPSSAGPGVAAPVVRAAGTAGDALSALVNLGYRRPEAQATVARVVDRLGGDAALDTIIRDSLKELATRTGTPRTGL